MSEIRKWLETIGLGQYADAFEASGGIAAVGTIWGASEL